MPVLDSLPDPDTIKRWKGVLDYYVWKDLPVVRRWPRKPSGPRSPAVTAAQIAFNDYIIRVRNTDQQLTTQATLETAGSPWWWRDPILRAAYGLLNNMP